jgi:hypothetical protein
MENEDKTYREKVWQFLDNMAHGDAYLIENLAISENRKSFILYVKLYMDTTEKPFQGNITFNRDYSKIYKTDEITYKKDIPKK